MFVCLYVGAQNSFFEEVARQSGLSHNHSWDDLIPSVDKRVTAALAVGDYNLDGLVDVYFETGQSSTNRLYQNIGNGQFIDQTVEAGLEMYDFAGGGCLFVDINDDQYPDLILGGLSGFETKVFLNNKDGTFADWTYESGLNCIVNVYSITAGDYDLNGTIDLFLTHWNTNEYETHLWKNNGIGKFVAADEEAGLYNPYPAYSDFSFVANFCDINNDFYPEILVVGDFGTSHVWLNQRDGSFRLDTENTFSDENGMGAAIADFDSDGDPDWFVSSIYDYDGVTEGNWGSSGNRMYENVGNGQFEEVSEPLNLRNGSWGWGSSFADIDLNGVLDIVHTNGWPRGADQFYYDSTRLFLAMENGTYSDFADRLGLVDTLQGRGVSTWDYDNDGDIDILVSNYELTLRKI
ncbi:MAG: VCBS repeat-containing protein [Bacteroidota bacterium]